MSGWGDYGAKAGLVEQVKQWQRLSPNHKLAWDNYCSENGHPKFDPNLKDEAFLQGFVDGCSNGSVQPADESAGWGGAAAGGGGGGGGDKSQLVEQVKSIQRQGYGYKQAWYKYCRQSGTQDFDPARHDPGTLSQFVSGVNSGAIQPCEDDGWGGGGGKGGKGGGKGGGDWWSDPWSMDPWQMMEMMKGMMKGKKGGGGGKGGGGKGKGGGPPVDGEIRYDDPNHAMQALQTLNGSNMKGSTITVEPDPKSKDGTKLVVSGIPSGCQWQELKDHFSHIGTVAYAGVNDGSGGKGKFKGFSPY